MPPLLQIGHRRRAPLLSTDDIPALQGGIQLAQQFGNTWYVNSAATAGGNGASPSGAKTTLGAALAIAVSGDTILIAPGHTETVSSAAYIAWTQSGITVMGLGNGSLRPTFTWSTTASTITMAGSNNVLSNIRCTSSVDEMVVMFQITGSFNTLDRVDHFETTSAQTIAFATFATGTDCTVSNCFHYQATAATATQIWITATSNTRFKLLNNTFMLALANAAAGAVFFGVTSTNVLLQGNNVKLTGGTTLLSAFLSLNTTTGLVCYNNLAAAVTAETTINDMPGCYSFQTFGTETVDTNGTLDPIADT
jgi:hypothetical protein